MLLISSEFPPGPGGIGQHTASLLQAWPESDAVHLLTNQDYCSPKEAAQYQVALLRASQKLIPFVSRDKPLYPFQRALQALQLVRNTKASRIIVSGRFPLWLGGLIKTVYPRRRVDAFVHGTEITPKKNWQDKVNAWALKLMDNIYPVSSFTAKLLPNDIPNEKVSIIPNGIDPQWLERAAQNGNTKMPLKGSPRLLTVGNVTYRKGQHRVIRALPALLQRFPKAHYHIVGLPTLRAEMQALAEELNVAHALTFHGKVARETLYGFYSSCDLFIMLSENQADGDVEGFGIAILEANAFGMPAIGASGCGIEDAINEASGKLVDGDDSVAIAHAAAQIIAAQQRYAQGARQWAERHSWDVNIKPILR